MSKIGWRVVCPFLLLTFLLPGCSLKKAVQQSAPETRHFVLEASRSDSAGSAQNESVLYVRDMTVSPRYEGTGFVSKRGEAEYTTDFYNRFLIPPDLLVTQEVRDWVLAAGVFGQVIHSGSLVAPTHALEGRVNALYGDYSVQPPQAVLEIELFLVENPLDRSAVVFHERYREEVPLDDRKPESLVLGWNTGLARALGKLEAGLEP
jgi:ABC-type uncharacterized transport system auxiliary subunit